MVRAEASLVPSMGVLYVHQFPDGFCPPRFPLKADNSSSSATRDSPVILSMERVISIQATVQQVSICLLLYGLPVASSPEVNPPVLWRSPFRMLCHISVKAWRYFGSPVTKYISDMPRKSCTLSQRLPGNSNISFPAKACVMYCPAPGKSHCLTIQFAI